MVKYEKIIFVCTSNTNRSVMCEHLYKSMDTNRELEVVSKGIIVLFSEPVNPKTILVMENHELKVVNHTAELFEKEDVDENTLILTMSEKQKEKIIQEFELFNNIYTLKEFVGETGDVTDPYGKTLVEYEECFVELTRLIKKTLYKLNEEEVQ